MSNPKPVINAKQAVEDVRSGMSDDALMAKYDLSAKGLSSLFDKLVKGKMIEEAELEERLNSTMRSHVVDLAELAQLGVPRVRINPDDAVKSIRSGLTDSELMAKYGLSYKGLNSLLKKLVKAGIIKIEELDRRRKAFDWAELNFAARNGSPETDGNRSEGEPRQGLSQSGGSSFDLGSRMAERRTLRIAAAAVMMAVIVCAGAYMISRWGERRAATARTSAEAEATPPSDPTLNEAAQVVNILRAISQSESSSPSTGSGSEASSAAMDVERCLQDCERSHPQNTSWADDGLLRYCRQNCIAQNSERIKSIKNRYYK
ncbi:MAG: hypothetical protein V2B18_21045 [Pseudomonadota bacterium]